MFRSATSGVSALSGFVANGRQTVHPVSPAPSKNSVRLVFPTAASSRMTPILRLGLEAQSLAGLSSCLSRRTLSAGLITCRVRQFSLRLHGVAGGCPFYS